MNTYPWRSPIDNVLGINYIVTVSAKCCSGDLVKFLMFNLIHKEKRFPPQAERLYIGIYKPANHSMTKFNLLRKTTFDFRIEKIIFQTKHHLHSRIKNTLYSSRKASFNPACKMRRVVVGEGKGMRPVLFIAR